MAQRGDGNQEGSSRRRRRSGEPTGVARLAEGLLVVGLLLLPWAIGGVDAWAMYAMDLVILAAAALSFWSCRHDNPMKRLLCLPSLVLLGLTGFCLFQAQAWPESLLRLLDPKTAALHDELVPRVVESVRGLSPSEVPAAGPSRTLSADPEATRHQASRFFMAWILFQAVMGLGLRGGNRMYKRFAMLLVINGVLLTIFAIVQALQWNGKIYWIRQAPPRDAWSAGGPFVHHGHLADYLNLALGMGLGLLLTRTEWGQWNWKQGSKLWWLYGCGLLIVGVAASQSRGGAIAMALSGIAFLILVRPPLKVLIGGIGGSLILGLIFLNALGSEATVARLRTTVNNEKVHEVRWRIDLWRQAVEAWSRHPALGVGLGAFQVGMAPELDRDFDYYFDHAENEYATILVEGGVVGVGLSLLGILGVFWLIAKAARSTTSSNRRVLIMGAAFSILAFSVHNFTDFGAEIPAVGLTAVAICGHVCGLGLRSKSERDSSSNGELDPDWDDEIPSSRRDQQEPNQSSKSWIGLIVLGTSCLIGSFIILPHDHNRHSAAWLVLGADLPRPATRKAVAMNEEISIDLIRAERALTQALSYRPDWYEGHMRLALTRLSQYYNSAFELLSEEHAGKQPKETLQTWATPIWLRRSIIEQDKNGTPLDLDEAVPAIDRLQLAAASLLEVRRCCPEYAPAHAWLGCLDFLLEKEPRPKGKATPHCVRALRSAGSDDDVIWMTAELADQDDDDLFLAQCWQRSLRVRERDWPAVAAACGRRLSPQFILEHVINQGRHALWFADALYAEPDKQDAYRQFLNYAVDNIPQDRNLERSQYLFFEAQARARRGDNREQVIRLMEEALSENPNNFAWRLELVVWLVEWNRIKDAEEQAKIAISLAPNDDNAKKAQAIVLDAVAPQIPIPKVEDKPSAPQKPAKNSPNSKVKKEK